MTKKTDLALALNEHPRFVGPRKYRYHSPIISAEWGGFTNAPWGEGLINFDREKEAWRFKHTSFGSNCLSTFPSVPGSSTDSTQVHQWVFHQRWYDFRCLEDRLKALGFRLVLCYRRAETFLEAKNERLKISGNASQYYDLARIIREQDELCGAFCDSQLEKLMLDITDTTVATAADEIVAWLEESGAF